MAGVSIPNAVCAGTVEVCCLVMGQKMKGKHLSPRWEKWPAEHGATRMGLQRWRCPFREPLQLCAAKVSADSAHSDSPQSLSTMMGWKGCYPITRLKLQSYRWDCHRKQHLQSAWTAGGQRPTAVIWAYTTPSSKNRWNCHICRLATGATRANQARERKSKRR